MTAAAPDPKILHVDMDAFYASVEIRDRPELADRPVAVGGTAEGRGVISAANYPAREYGVRSALPTARALQLCPELVLLPPDFDKYTTVSREIMRIFRSYTPLVEPLSLDEAFLDVSGCERLHGNAETIGRKIRSDILRETGLVASIGVAPTKFLAKLASDLDKPDGFRVIRGPELREVLDPLPVSKIFGVGERTAKRLESMGVTTIGQLASKSRDEVKATFGATGTWIHDLAHGIDDRRVTPNRVEKSHGKERTFPEDVTDRELLRRCLYDFAEEVAYDLRDRGLRGKTVSVKARFWNFKTVTRSKTLDFPTNLGPRIFATARELLERVPAGPLRLLGVQVSNLEDVRTPVQTGLFDDGAAFQAPREDTRLGRATEGVDQLRRRFGRDVVRPASLIDAPDERRGSRDPRP
ncbi:Y-family DNA polymerase [Engelhardtia mirabilis]|uniref:DNA polymerase IV n=1 Tax=Engelhardtia mirabilis TaxID=2528011 RepID=A0A518BID7_9BACT|nr:DNA polymerase IV [Planctomycetes bacterium Pla133]QDV01062.1 DNA polymerase IV [Planctomycetes bacterium Pla86]